MALCARNAQITVYDVTTWSWVNLVHPGLGTRTLFGNFFGNNGLISLEKNFRAKFVNDVIFNA